MSWKKNQKMGRKEQNNPRFHELIDTVNRWKDFAPSLLSKC